MNALHYDPFIGLELHGEYFTGDGKSQWLAVTPDELRTQLQGDQPPLFRTVLARTGEDQFAGPLFFDIDSGDIEDAIEAFHALLSILEGKGVDLEMVRLFATGCKGFHLEIPAQCYMPERGAVQGLPRIFKELAYQIYVDCVDLRVYSGGKGRMWRVPNVRRDNGRYKVPLTVSEALSITAEDYGLLCSQPRSWPDLKPPTLVPGLALLFSEARDKIGAKTSRVRKWSAAESALRARFSGDCPPSVQGVLSGKVQSRAGFNETALQVSLLAHALGWDEDRTLSECRGLIQNHAGDGSRYNSPHKREQELIRMFDYTDKNAAYGFSAAALRSILPSGTRSPDLQGLQADEAEDQPDYISLIDEAGDVGEVVAVARQVVADPSLSKTEAEALIKRAAKSSGVAVKVLKQDLYAPDEAGKRFIDVVVTDFAASVDSAMAVLPAVPGLRVRAGSLVELAGGKFSQVSLARLAYLLSSVARWRYGEGNGKPDVSVLQAVLAAGSWPGVPEVVGVALQPMVGSPDGFEPDYCPDDFPEFEGSGKDAIEALRGLLSEFAFASVEDEAAALAAILTAVARPTLRTAPGFLVSAHDIGSGKSYLAELVGLFAGAEVQMQRWPAKAEEQDKVLLSLLIEGRQLCVFDNLMRDWASGTLAAILTSPTYSDRVLGASEAVQVSTRCLWVATGNNVRPAADLSRRIITIQLDAAVENPLTRQFKGDPVQTVRADRGRWVMTALRALKGFREAVADGATEPSLTPFASFGEWSALIRGALAWYGLPDVVQSVVAQVETDDDRETLSFILETWAALFGAGADAEPLTLRDVILSICNVSSGDAAALRGLFMEVAGERGEVDSRKLGRWVSAQAGRVAGGRRIVQFGGRTKCGKVWLVEDVR
jgi:hypothetical protein